MTPSNPFQPLPRKHSKTPSTPSIGKGLGLGVVDHPFHLAAVTELNRGETMRTQSPAVEVRTLIEACDVLNAMQNHYAHREVFTAGLAAGRNHDRDGVDNAISRLTSWSEYHLHCASIRDITCNLDDAATLARAARIVWCCYVYLAPKP